MAPRSAAEEEDLTSSWSKLKHGDDFRTYSKRPLCSMRWTLDAPLARCMSALMPAGGPIALLTGDGTAPGARMQLFSGTGVLLSAWEWDFGRVRALGWTRSVELVCVLESGRVMLWSLRGTRTSDFALGEAMEHQGVLLCSIFADGIVVLTTAYRLFALLSFSRRTIVPLADPRLASPPSCMAQPRSQPQQSSSELVEAVLGCIEAAKYEPRPEGQRELLRAAAFGKAYAPRGVDKDVLARTCATLRVLNAVRKDPVGMPMTWQQFESLGASGAVEGLLARHEHLLAWHVAEFLHMPQLQASIVMHWCRSTVNDAAAGFPDGLLIEQLRPKLAMGRTAASRPKVADVAAEAHRVGRTSLALTLLDEFNSPASQQVPLLLSMGELHTALSRACASSDVELVYLALLHAKSSLPEVDFLEMLTAQPSAQRLLARYCTAREPQLLKTLYYHSNQPIEAAALAIREAYKASTWAQRMRGLSIALQFYEHSTNALCAPLARATEEQLKLLDAQRSLERDTRGKPNPPGAPPALAERFRFIDLPLNETLYKCFAFGQSGVAERLRAELKLPEKRFWRLKLRGLAHARNWPALWELGNVRKSPIGFKPFADACIGQGALDEAAKYAPKLAAADAVPVWLRIGRIDDARRVALQYKEKQPELLKMVTDAALANVSSSSAGRAS